MGEKVADKLREGLCPNCWSKGIEIKSDYINCRACGTHGNPEIIRWCTKVPVYDVMTDNGPATIKSLSREQVYEYHGIKYVLAGYAPGCLRPISGDYCTSCISIFPKILPTPTKSNVRKRHRDDDDKSSASGEKE